MRKALKGVKPKAIKRPFGKKRTKPLWTLEDGVTQGMLCSYASCPEQTALNWIDGYTPKRISIPLDFGSIMHLCLQHQFDYEDPETCAFDVCRQYEGHRSKTLAHSGERDRLKELTGLAQITFPAYAKFWQRDDEQIHWVSREEQFDIPYEFRTDERKYNIRLRGMRDGIYRIGKKLGIFETKNKSLIREDEVSKALKADMQTMFYVFATFLEYGEMPNEITYNVIRRSSLYRRKGEAVDVYLKRVKADIAKRTNFERRSSDYFMRWEVTLLKSDIDNFVNLTLNPLLIRFIEWWESIKKNPMEGERYKSPRHFRNLNALHGKYGMSEFFEKIINNSNAPYFIRDVPFPELDESFQVTPPAKTTSASKRKKVTRGNRS